MEPTLRSSRLVRFGVFEVDLQAGELRKSGVKLKLTGQPFQVLTILLDHPGEVVTREELQKRLWPDTFVDAEHNLNTAINKIREVLGDSAENPSYVETLPRRGYRFVAPVHGIRPTRDSEPFTVGAPQSPVGDTSTKRFVRVYPAVVIFLVLLIAALVWWRKTNRLPRVTGSKRLTFTGQVVGPLYPYVMSVDFFSSLATDGSRLYYTSLQQSRNRLSYVSLSGGDQVVMPLPLFADLRHISPNGSTLLAFGHLESETKNHLWFIPTAGGGPRLVGKIDGQDGAWSRDGNRIAFANGAELFVADSEGTNIRKIATTPGRAFWLRWSADSARIRFTILDSKSGKSTLWECRSNGSDLRPLSLSGETQSEECCGDWTKDGRYFLFRVFRENRADIWAAPESILPFSKASPVRLTTGPLDSVDAIPSLNGRQLLTLEAQPRSELRRLDLKTRDLSSYLPGVSAADTRPIPGNEWIVYIEARGKETTVWRSRPDGSERLQLTAPPLYAFRTTPSPDGKQIALMAKMPDKPWRIYLVPTNGGPLNPVTPEDQNAADPTWSPDGHSLMFSGVPDQWADPSLARSIRILNLETGQTTTVPASNSLFSPRWSPDGQYIIAMTQDFQTLMLFDFSARTWTELASGRFDFPEWHPDSKHVYVNAYPKGHINLVRIEIATRQQEQVLALESVNPNAFVCWMIVPPQETALLVTCVMPAGDLYALDLDLP